MKKFDFNKNASEYEDYYTTDFGKKVDKIEKKCIKKYLEKIQKGKSLEIGCGTGHWTEFFVSQGFRITGIDIAQDMLNIAKSKNLEKTNFIVADVLDLPFENESFDNVFAITSLEFTENQQKAFDEIYRIMKKNGYFLIGGLLDSSELAKNKNNSEIFCSADFFSVSSLKKYLNKFGKPQIETCLKIKNNKIIENNTVTNHKNDTFIVGFVKKE
jgi:ubiquinone/menaquinone biosynthesis C-methylase UbiE